MTFLNWLFVAWSINMQLGRAGYARWTLTHCPKNAKNFYKIPAVNQLWLPWLFSASLERQKCLTTLAKQVLVVFLSHMYSLHFDGQATASFVNYDLRHKWNSHECNWHRRQQVKCVASGKNTVRAKLKIYYKFYKARNIQNYVMWSDFCRKSWKNSELRLLSHIHLINRYLAAAMTKKLDFLIQDLIRPWIKKDSSPAAQSVFSCN